MSGHEWERLPGSSEFDGLERRKVPGGWIYRTWLVALNKDAQGKKRQPSIGVGMAFVPDGTTPAPEPE